MRLAILSLGVVTLAGTMPAQGHDAVTSQPQPAALQAPAPGLDEAGGALAANPAATRPVQLPSSRVPVHTAPPDNGLDYGIWAAGSDYKASFHDGMTWVPYLGRDYPHNQPFHWTTRSVRVGGQELLGTGDPVVTQAEYRYEYRHGVVTEAYDVLAEGLEQTFVLLHKPSQGGDLVITGAVQTALRSKGRAPAHQALVFTDAAGRAILDYGRAFAIDAKGRRVEVLTGHEAGAISLHVPGAWLATAAFPVTVDPLLTPVTLQVGTTAAVSVDVVRDDLNNQLLQCYARFTSATDADAYARIYPDSWSTGGAGTLVFSDLSTTWSTPETSCSLCGPQNTFVIGLVREVPAPAIRIWAQPTSTATLVTAVVSGTFASTRSDWQIAVGGIEKYNQSGAAVTGTHALVVFQRDASGTPGSNLAESEIWGLLVDCTTSPATVGTAFEIGSTTAGMDSEHPDVIKYSDGGTPSTWVVAYQEYNNGITGDDWDLIARQVDNTGAIATSYWFPTVASGTHKLEPKIEGQRGRYCVFHCRVDQTTLTKISGYDGLAVDVERFNWPAGGAITRFTSSNLGNASGSIPYLRVLDAAYDSDVDSFWLGIWHADGRGSRNMFLDRVGYRGKRVEVASIVPGTPNFTCAAGSYDDDAKDFVFTYGNDDGTASNPLFGNVFDYPTETAPSLFGTACSPATITWRALEQNAVVIAANDQQIGHEFTGVEVAGAPAGALHFMLLSFQTANVQVPSPMVPASCRLLIDPVTGYIGALPIAFGPSARWNLPLPEGLSSLTLHMQDWHTNSSATQVWSTQRLTVSLVR